jgi:polyphosphate glucokinase
MITGPVTTGAITNGPLTTGPLTTEPVTSQSEGVAPRSDGDGGSRPGSPRRRGAPNSARSIPARSGSRQSGRAPELVTVALDIGGTGLKAALLDPQGGMLGERVRHPTTYPCSPTDLVGALRDLVGELSAAPYDRVSAGFPGVVRKGRVLTAPHFVTVSGPGSRIDPDLVQAWTGFDLAAALEVELDKPARVANDADLQGYDVVSGKGLEFVVTLGTGVGTALFEEGRLAPHLELAHHEFRKCETYNEQLGDAALHRIGKKKWRRRVAKAIESFAGLLNYDRLYIGGGNAEHLRGHVEESITLVDNVAGILGGIKLWEER